MLLAREVKRDGEISNALNVEEHGSGMDQSNMTIDVSVADGFHREKFQIIPCETPCRVERSQSRGCVITPVPYECLAQVTRSHIIVAARI